MDNSAQNPLFLCEGNARSKVFVISCSLRSRDSKDSYRALLYHCQLSNCKKWQPLPKILSFSARAKPEARCYISCSLRSIYPDLSGRDSKDSYRVLLYHCQLSNCKLSNCQISIRFLGIRETAVLHRLNVISHRRAYIARQFSKVAQELRFEARI